MACLSACSVETTATTTGGPFGAAPPGSATAAPSASRPGNTSVPTAARWQPRRGTTWQWQLSGPIQTSVDAQVYDVDLVDTPASTVASLHRDGRRVVCYLSAGSWEPGRPDSALFPTSVRGSAVPGWDERWLDIRQLSVLGPIMAARMDLCAAKGFDGVEADLVDGYASTTGFPLTADDQLTYDRMLARMAHERGLAIGLKNDLDQVAALEPVYDFAVNEQCVQYDECDRLAPFLDADKAVFHAEYDLSTAQFCPTSQRLGLSSVRKELELGPWRQTC
ncbi:endo alpha-1,4 polygalactosaminidase [Dermatophilaceae bacterium Soc4.6]